MSRKDNPFSLDSTITMLNDNFLIVVMVIVAFVIGFFAGSVWTENQMLRSGRGTSNTGIVGQPTADAGAGVGAEVYPIENMPAVNDADHVLGAKNAKVTIVEYSDMNCPFCRAFHPTMKQIVADYPNDVAWVYRHFPFQGQNSTDAAVTSECIADKKGNDAFWKFTDSLFAKADAQGSLTRELIFSAAAEVGLAEAEVTACMGDTKYQGIVTAHQTGGSSAGVTGTPASIVVTADGPQEFISGALPVEQIKMTIENYL